MSARYFQSLAHRNARQTRRSAPPVAAACNRLACWHRAWSRPTPPRNCCYQAAPDGASTAYVPPAKWFTLEIDGDFIVVKAHASPILPGATLRRHLWSSVRGNGADFGHADQLRAV